MAGDSRAIPLYRRIADLQRVITRHIPDFTRDVLAGLVASTVLIANIISFGTLMFPGELAIGIPTAIWSLLVGSCIIGVWVSLTTSIPPIATGIDSPTGAVFVLLSAAIASTVVEKGGTPETATIAIMLILTAATFVSGALFLVIGHFRWAAYFRFVPYFVVGGFLAATGWLLVAGGIQMTTGKPLGLELFTAPWTQAEALKLACAAGTLAILLILRQLIKSVMTIPVSLLIMWILGALALRWLGMSETEHGWYFPSMGVLHIWTPFTAVHTPGLHWPTMVSFIPEIIAVTLVALLSLVTKVSSLEVTREASGDLNCEFRSHGLSTILTGLAGGLMCNLQNGTSRLLEQAGSATRMSGVVCALIIGVVALADFNLAGMIPIPVIAGLVFYLGYTFFIDALARPFQQRAWLDLFPAIGIAIVCVMYGYLAGVLLGLVGACLMFAISYARVGVVRRGVTRAKFSSNVDRSSEASEHLHNSGDAIQLYWLSGYIFFGCSEGVLERIRGDIEALPPGRVAYIILDFAMVTGSDSSAIISLSKLRNYCDQHDITLIYCALSRANYTSLEKGRFFGGKTRHHAFRDQNSALAWCEDQLLAKTDIHARMASGGFESWLQRQLGDEVKSSDLIQYLERRDIVEEQLLYSRGDPADSVDLVAAGALVVEIPTADGTSALTRRIMTHTVVGEMGFFRRSVRSANVLTEGAATIYTLTRDEFTRMQQKRPDLAAAFYNFIICVLADRIEFSNREIAALSA